MFLLFLSSLPHYQAEYLIFQKWPILYFRIPHNALCLPLKFCINHCFQMLLGICSVARDRPNLFVKSRVRYIENLDVTNLRGNDQNVRYIEVIVND